MSATKEASPAGEELSLLQSPALGPDGFQGCRAQSYGSQSQVSTVGPSVHFRVSTTCRSVHLLLRSGSRGLLQPLQDASGLDMPGAWSISQILAGGKGMVVCVVGGRSRGTVVYPMGVRNLLCWREKR